MHPDEQAVVAQAAAGAQGRVQASSIRNLVQANHIDNLAVSASLSPEWPHQVGVLPPSAAARQRREADSILECASDGRILVLSGMGGVGKTQTAAAYARHRWNARELDLLVWINAITRDAIGAALGQAAVDICGASPNETDANAIRFVAWLSKPGCRWLLVFDDLTDPVYLEGLWPPPVQDGRVIITTRRRDAALEGEGRQRIDVDAFSERQALNYLVERLGSRPGSLDGAAELVDTLGRLPLALAQAAAYIQDQPGLSCAGYGALLADRTVGLAELRPDVLPDGYGQTVAAAWSLSIDHADRLTPGNLIKPILRLTGLLDPNGIPANLFTTPTVLHFLNGVNARAVERALGRLRQVGLIQYDGDRVRIHAVIQRAVIDEIDEPALEHVAAAAGDGLLELWPEIERDPAETGILRSNVSYLRRSTERVLLLRRIHPVLFRVGASLGFQGQVAEAVDYCQELYEASRASFGPEHEQTRLAQDLLASWKGEAGEVQFAVTNFAESYEYLAAKRGPLDRETLQVRNLYGFWLIRSGDFTGAIAVFEAMMPDVVQAFGADDPFTFVVRHNLATCRGETGDVTGAVAAFERLVADRTRVLGPDAWNTLATRGSLARWRGEAGDAPGAVAALEELLGDCLNILGPVHPDTFEARRSLAVWQGAASDPQEAVATLEGLLPSVIEALGVHHPVSLAAAADLASWQGRSDRPTDAVTTLEALLGDCTSLFGADDARTLNTRANLAGWKGRTGNAASAAAAFKELLADRCRVLGPDHPHTLTTRQNLADWQGAAGDIPGAVEALEELSVDRTRVLGPDHPDTLTTRHSLARWQGRNGDPTGAVAGLEKLLADRRRVLGPDHPHTLTTKANLAHWHGKAGDLRRAATLLGEVLVDRNRLFGPAHPVTALTQRNLGFWETKLDGSTLSENRALRD